MAAALFKKAPTVRVLIDLRADVNQRDPCGINDTPLMHSACDKDADAVRALLEARADVNAVNSRGLLRSTTQREYMPQSVVHQSLKPNSPACAVYASAAPDPSGSACARTRARHSSSNRAEGRADRAEGRADREEGQADAALLKRVTALEEAVADLQRRQGFATLKQDFRRLTYDRLPQSAEQQSLQ
jgi:ankyrin repeat protein